MKTYIKDNAIYVYLCTFLIISYLSIYNTSIYLYPTLEKIYYKQLAWYTLGIIIINIIKKIKIESILKYSKYLYILNIILLLGLFFFGIEINNSKAWYSFLGISFQPSEFMKICIILLDIYIIEKNYKNKKNIKNKDENKVLVILFIVFLIPSILTFLEPDTGAIISYLIITLSIIYISNTNKKIINRLIIYGLITISLFFLFYYLFQDMFINIFGSNMFYRIDRLINWQSRSGMQLNNSLVAIGSSGLLGHNNIPLYYPEMETDFIFTSFSSVYGIIGGIVLIITALSFDLYILKLIKKEPNRYNKYLLFSIAVLFFYQHIQSIGMTIGLLPIMGITFPLISYGGSSLISYLILVGLIINIKEKA